MRRDDDRMFEVEITDVHDEVALTELRERLIAHNIAVTGYDDGRSLSCFLRDEEGEMVAGLDGFTWGGYAKIEWLWLAEHLRGSGLGTRMVGAAEAEAAARGCRVVRVDTHTFQAPGFYERLGYRRIGDATDTPVGHGEIFYVKELRRQEE